MVPGSSCSPASAVRPVTYIVAPYYEGYRDAFADTAAGFSDDGDFACQRDHSVASCVAVFERSPKNSSL